MHFITLCLIAASVVVIKVVLSLKKTPTKLHSTLLKSRRVRLVRAERPINRVADIMDVG